MRKYVWNVTAATEEILPEDDGLLWPAEDAAPAPEDTAPVAETAVPTEREYKVTYAFSRMKGRITLAIDGDAFDLPAGPLGLKAARREIFRLGGEQAVLTVEKSGKATLTVRGEMVPYAES